MVTREEFYMDSADGIHMLHGYRWFDPEVTYQGVLLLVHGMFEYIERYQELAEYMASAGYFVAGHDHLGHGDSVKDLTELGQVEKQGAIFWLKDIERVRKMAVSYAPKAPCILLGHSMGSYLVRRYLIYNADRVDGAVIMGTGHQPRLLVKAGLLLTYLSMLRRGPKGHSALLNNFTCTGFAKRYPDNAHTGSWMSRDPKVLVQVLQEERMNFEFSLYAFKALFETIEEVIDPKRAARMPKSLPLLILSGDEDPVGENGRGVRRFTKMLKKIGMEKVSCKLYPGDRHELIHELDKDQVLHDIQKWCETIQNQHLPEQRP